MLRPQQNDTADGTLAPLQEFWSQYGDAVETLSLFAGGILVYALLVNFFYQRLDKRVMFGKAGPDGKVRVGGPGRGFIYLIFFPFFSLLYFLLLSAALLFLGGQDQSPIHVFTLAMAIVLAVRVAAYFSESAAHDLAKMLPLGLLGVVLVTSKVLDLVSSVEKMLEIFDHLDVVAVYFGIVVIAEYLLRTIYLIGQSGKDSKKRRSGKVPPSKQAPPQR